MLSKKITNVIASIKKARCLNQSVRRNTHTIFLNGRSNAIPRQSVSKSGGQFAQTRMQLILGGQNCVPGRYGPCNTELRVVPPQAAVAFPRIIIGYLIKDLRMRLERAEAMRETLRHPQLAPVLRVEQSGNVPAESGRSQADIYCDIEYRTSYDAYQFVLRMGWNLKMQAAYNPAIHRKGMIILHEMLSNPERLKRVGIEGLGKEAAFVPMNTRRYQFYFWDLEGSNPQCHISYPISVEELR